MEGDKFTNLIKKLHTAQKTNNKYEIIYSLLELGKFYFDSEQYIKSRLTFQEVLQINPKIKEVNYYLGLIELKLSNTLKAKKYLKEELKNNPTHTTSKYLLEKITIKTNFPIITLLLVLLNLIIFYFTHNNLTLTFLIKMTTNHFNYSITTLITSLFIHSNIIHLLSNMIVLFIFGLILEKYIGSAKFLFLYLIGGIISNLFQLYFGSLGFILGASGAIFAVLGGLVMYDPLLKVRFLGLFKIPIIILFGSIFIILNFITNYILYQNIIFADIAHIMGFLIGMFIVSAFYPSKVYIFYNWLVIGFGFYLISISLNSLIYSIYTYKTILINLILIIMSIFLISYSYYKLKLTTNVIQSNLFSKIAGERK